MLFILLTTGLIEGSISPTTLLYHDSDHFLTYTCNIFCTVSIKTELLAVIFSRKWESLRVYPSVGSLRCVGELGIDAIMMRS